MELLKTVILGIVEGLTEWLPISSTGHMILVDEFIQLNVTKAFMDMFLVVIQLGAILAVVVLNAGKLNPFLRRKSNAERRETFDLWGKVIFACIPAGAIGLALNKYMEEHFMNAPVVASMLILYGVLFIIVERWNRVRTPRIEDLSQLDYRTAFIIGVFQVLSLVPGTSRSGATILGGILFGASRYDGVHVLPRNSCDVRRELSKAGEIWLSLYGGGTCHSCRRNGDGVYCVHSLHSLPPALHQAE